MDLVLSGVYVDPLEGEKEGYIGIENGVITYVGEEKQIGAQEIILQEGQLLFPGFIDPHVHLREPGGEAKEDFVSGTRAALKGGVTTVIDMPNNSLPTVSLERLNEKISLSQKAKIDVFFHGGVNNIQGILAMKDKVKGYKVYLAKTTGNLLITASECEKFCESLASTGKPIVFHVSEPERDGVQEAIGLGEKYNFPVHIAHLSTESGLNSLKRGVTSEVSPHHLLFSEEDREKNPFLVMKPPLATQQDKNALLQGIKNGTVTMLGTDHAPHLPHEKEASALGIPGLEVFGNTAAWLLNQGIDKQRVAQFTSYNAAQRFSLEQRGRIKEGFLANLVILNTGKTETISPPFATKCGWSPYQGMVFPGGVAQTIFRGKIVI